MRRLSVARQAYAVDAVLFDKDGTLLELDSLWAGWLARVLECLGTELMPSVELNQKAMHRALGVVACPDAVIDPAGPLAVGAMDDVMSILAQVLYQQHGIAWNDAVKVLGRARYNAESTLYWGGLIRPIAGVQRFVAAVQAAGVPMGVVTSDDHDSAVRHLHCLGLETAFSVVVGHDDVAQGKPLPDMIHHACRTLGVAPERTLLFGDSNGDMQMARAAAMVAGIGLATGSAGNHLREADQVISDYLGCGVAAAEL